MKKVKYPNLDDYDLSCYEELKGDILYMIDGGAVMSQADQAAIAEQNAEKNLLSRQKVLADSYLGYTVTAHSSKSGETKEFRNYSELYDYLYSGTGDTVSAVMHYFNPFNKGAAVRVGKKAFDNVKRENNKIFEERIKSGLTESSNGNYSLNVVSKENPTRRNDFFIGTTRLELPFGKVYPFETRSWTETFGNPPVMNWLRENENE